MPFSQPYPTTLVPEWMISFPKEGALIGKIEPIAPSIDALLPGLYLEGALKRQVSASVSLNHLEHRDDFLYQCVSFFASGSGLLSVRLTAENGNFFEKTISLSIGGNQHQICLKDFNLGEGVRLEDLEFTLDNTGEKARPFRITIKNITLKTKALNRTQFFFTTLAGGTFNMKIFTTSGKVVKKLTGTCTSGFNKQIIEKENLADGIYYYILRIETGEILSGNIHL